MTWWNRLWRGGWMEEQLEKELAFHLERHAAELSAVVFPRTRHAARPA